MDRLKIGQKDMNNISQMITNKVHYENLLFDEFPLHTYYKTKKSITSK